MAEKEKISFGKKLWKVVFELIDLIVTFGLGLVGN